MAASATLAYQGAQNDLVTLALADLSDFWRTLDRSDAVGTRDALLAFLPDIVQTYGEMGAELAAVFYEELRDASPKVTRPYAAVLSDDVVPLEKIAASTRWALGSLWTSADDAAFQREAAAFTNLSGVTKRHILTPARDTVRLNVSQDPDAVGWRRLAQGAETCKFCRMLVDRGNVYSADTARFAAHDDCDCTAEPAFGAPSDFTPVGPVPFMASKRNPTRADRQRVKDYLRMYEE